MNDRSLYFDGANPDIRCPQEEMDGIIEDVGEYYDDPNVPSTSTSRGRSRNEVSYNQRYIAAARYDNGNAPEKRTKI